MRARSKRCSVCRLTKTLEQFYPRRFPSGNVGRGNRCKPCQRIVARNWHRGARERFAQADAARQRARYQIPAVREARKESARAYYRRMKACA